MQWVDAEHIERDGAEAQFTGVHGILVPGGFGDRGHPGQDRSGALRPRAARAVPRHLPGHAVRGHRVRAKRLRPRRRELLGVRSEFAASGDRSAPGAARARRQGRHDATGPLSDRPGRGQSRLAAVRAGDHPGASSPSLRGEQRLSAAAREDRPRASPGSGPRSSWWRSSRSPSIPYFVAGQFHPEFRSRPWEPHPLFAGFIEAALAHPPAPA